MSYDYNELVTKINTNRRRYYETNEETETYAATSEEEAAGSQHQQYLQVAVDTYAELSSVCPMTPLLWMQYSYDTGKLMTTLLLLEGDNDNHDTEEVNNHKVNHT